MSGVNKVRKTELLPLLLKSWAIFPGRRTHGLTWVTWPRSQCGLRTNTLRQKPLIRKIYHASRWSEGRRSYTRKKGNCSALTVGGLKGKCLWLRATQPTWWTVYVIFLFSFLFFFPFAKVPSQSKSNRLLLRITLEGFNFQRKGFSLI